MAAIFAMAAYLAAGLILSHVILWDKSPLLRAWAGLTLGFLLMMWLPALFAFLLAFTSTAQFLALVTLSVTAAGALAFRHAHPRVAKRLSAGDRKMLLAMACFALPLTILSGYLQHTHTLRDVDGALHVGQSTYGDLNMHLSIVLGLRDSALPSNYLILPDTTLGYPVLVDGLSTSLLMLGMPLRWAFILPGTLMSGLVFCGYLLLAREMTGKTSAAVIAGVLLFFNGGLGFLYDFDLPFGDLSKLREIFTGFYQTPANQPDLNLRWSNLVVDLLLPQRTFLGGWLLLLPALYFTREAFFTLEKRMFLLAALFGAALPIVHTHSFLALGLYSAGALFCAYFRHTARRRALLSGAGLYLGIVLAAAVPQLLAFTFTQATGNGFVRLHFNWVNNVRGQLIDFYPWFWLKNIGLPLIVMVFAALDMRRRNQMDFVGAVLIFVVAETILFQPLDYDNNKLFYVWYLLLLPAAGGWCVSLWNRMKGMRARSLLAALFLVASTLSGALSMAREAVSDYQLFSAPEAQAAAFIEENTGRDDMFLTGLHHNNFVYALGGRTVVCGPSNFLSTHGLDYQTNMTDVKMFYDAPADHLDVLDRYGVDYIVLGNSERYLMAPDEAGLDALFDVAYENDSVKIYAVDER